MTNLVISGTVDLRANAITSDRALSAAGPSHGVQVPGGMIPDPPDTLIPPREKIKKALD